jgi:hypothetical protein
MSNNSLQIEQLQQEYNNTLIKYKQAYLDYISAIENSSGHKYKQSPGKIFYNYTKSINTQNVNSINECEALCSADAKCDGGTMVSGGGCYISGGPNQYGDTNYGASYTAFEKPSLSHYKDNLDLLDSQLVNLNLQIQQAIAKNPTDKTNQTLEKGTQKILSYQYNNLLKERKQISDEEKAYNNITNEYNDSFISTVQENSQNTAWIFITIIVVCITAGMVIM